MNTLLSRGLIEEANKLVSASPKKEFLLPTFYLKSGLNKFVNLKYADAFNFWRKCNDFDPRELLNIIGIKTEYKKNVTIGISTNY